jgi:tetratricopeptide (TPR) repeat protein
VYEHQNRLPEAVSSLEKGLAAREVNRAQAYNTLGIVYWRQRDYSRSVTAAQKAIAINPQLVDAYLTLGITYEDMGYREQAMEQFRRGWKQGLDAVGIFNDWAMNFLGANKADRALFYLLEAIRLEPGRPQSHENLGHVYEAMGMIEEAQREREVARSLRNR